MFDSSLKYSMFSEVVTEDQVDSCVSGQVCSIIYSVLCRLHVVLINSLGAEALMDSAVAVEQNTELESNTERFTSNDFKSL